MTNGKCIKMSTNKPIFGPVVIEIAGGIFINNTHFFPLKPIASMKSIAR